MAKDVVENVGFLKVVELVGPADEAPGDKPPVGEVFEKQRIVDQPRHRQHLPAGGRHQPFRQPAEMRDAAAVHPQHRDPPVEFVNRAAPQHLGLPGHQPVPRRVFLRRIVFPALGDGAIGGRGLAGVDHGPD